KVFSFWGHIRIQNFESARVAIAEETPIDKSDSVRNLIRKHPSIASIQSFATKNAILKTSESIAGILFKGVERDYNFSNLQPFLMKGRWIHFNDSAYSSEINISQFTSKKLQLDINDKVIIYFIQPDGTTPRPRKLTVTGIYKTGIEEYDKIVAIGDLALIQRLNNWEKNMVGGYEIFVKDYKQMDKISEEIYPDIPIGLKSNTIKELYPNIFDWLALQNQTILIVVIIMVAIASLNLITCLLILVLERTRMIGILKAIGAQNGTVQQLFLIHGAIITITGLFFGNLGGLLVCWIQKKYQFIRLPEDAYYMPTAAVNIVWWQVALVNTVTLLICLLVLLIPTILVKRIRPVRAIQFR
ncbi:MAG TPA: FtsX-like permease family protein, partial [Flavitalea sp.]|nr:FtsX-like permease family protein [Flavitalea sp.]